MKTTYLGNLISASYAWNRIQAAETYLPAVLRRAMRRMRSSTADPFSEEEGQKVLFIHIPKTGGTSIAKALRFPNRHCELDQYFLFDGRRAAESFKACFVRHPCDRLLSSFAYLRGMVGEANTRDAIWASRYLKSYANFNAFVLDLDRPAVRRRILSYTHFRSQVSWIRVAGVPSRMNFIGRFESIDKDFLRLAEIMGVSDRSLPYLRSSRHELHTEAYSAFTKRIVETVYAEDFEHFGYN
jgi:hypothetical protein